MSIDEEFLVEYMRRLHQLELDGAHMEVDTGPYTAMILIGALQLAMRHPAMEQGQLEVLTHLIDQLAAWFDGTPGEELIRLGMDPSQDRA